MVQPLAFNRDGTADSHAAGNAGALPIDPAPLGLDEAVSALAASQA
jgi:hypothetical protein